MEEREEIGNSSASRGSEVWSLASSSSISWKHVRIQVLRSPQMPWIGHSRGESSDPCVNFPGDADTRVWDRCAAWLCSSHSSLRPPPSSVVPIQATVLGKWKSHSTIFISCTGSFYYLLLSWQFSPGPGTRQMIAKWVLDEHGLMTWVNVYFCERLELGPGLWVSWALRCSQTTKEGKPCKEWTGKQITLLKLTRPALNAKYYFF